MMVEKKLGDELKEFEKLRNDPELNKLGSGELEGIIEMLRILKGSE